MKKIAILCLTFFLISLTSAVEFNIQENYPQGGAILATISGSFQETLTKEDFQFYRGSVRIPMNFELSKLHNIYYLYANLADKEPANYSVVIEDVEYLKGTKVVEEDIQKNFSISEQIADFSINNGIIITEDDFSINVQNLQDFKINLSYKFADSIATTELYSGEIKSLGFNVENISVLEIQNLELSSGQTNYIIPVYVLESPDKKTPVDFSFTSSEINIILDLNNETKKIIYLENTGSEEIFQIKFSLDSELEKYVSLSDTELFNLSAGFLYPVEISIFSDELPRKISGNLTAVSGNVKKSVVLNISFFPGYVSDIAQEKICSEMNGVLCEDASSCDGQIVSAPDGNCCFGNCASTSSSVSFKYIGWIILILVIVLIVWIYFKKYRRAEAPAKGVFKFAKKE